MIPAGSLADSRPWQAVVWHHSATKDGETNDWAGIKRYHVEEKGWRDIGYHWGVERVSGKLELKIGRPLSWEGGHCVGKNKIAIGVCVVGNFDLAAPDAETLAFAVRLGQAIGEVFPLIRPESHFYHRQFAPRTCPGTKFPALEEFRRLLGQPAGMV